MKEAEVGQSGRGGIHVRDRPGQVLVFASGLVRTRERIASDGMVWFGLVSDSYS